MSAPHGETLNHIRIYVFGGALGGFNGMGGKRNSKYKIYSALHSEQIVNR